MAPDARTSSYQSKRKSNGDATKKQQSISQSFNSSKQDCAPEVTPSPQKRRKLDGSQARSSVMAASTENMYNFSSTNGKPVIDLTKSPSPRKRFVTGVSTKIDPGSRPNGAKKLVVKNLRTTSRSDPNNYCNKTLVKLDDALTEIFQGQRLTLSNEELYKGCENVCKLGKAEDLAKKLSTRMRDHVAKDVWEILAKRSNEKNAEVLRLIISSWASWKKQLNTIQLIFFYLDRSYLLQTSSPSIFDSGVATFRSQIFRDKTLADKAIDGACDLLLADRLKNEPDLVAFREAIEMFHETMIYTNEFEPRLLQHSQAYIKEWSDRESAEKDLPEYVAESVKFIQDEVDRCDSFNLDDTTKRDLLTQLEHHLIERKEDDLSKFFNLVMDRADPRQADQVGVSQLLDINALGDLGQVFSMLERRRLGIKLRAPFAQWIDTTGTGIVFDEKSQDDMVVRLLELKSKLDNVWRHAFNKHQELGHTLRESFEAFINKSKKTTATWNTDNSKPGEMIAKYVDQLLRAGAKAIPTQLSSSNTMKPGLGKTDNMNDMDDDEVKTMDDEVEVNKQLDQVLDLFRFVHGKAVFEAFYKKDLARRLLMGRSASNDAEKSMLARLKNECGHSFTQNLEQMFKDVELARDEMVAYKERIEANGKKQGVDLSVNTLSQSAWPFYPDVPVIIPPEVKRAIDEFEKVYHQKHTGRKLQWKHALAHCQLKADFPKGKKELVVSSFQAIVLLIFNGAATDEHVTYERIKAESGLTDAEAKRTLQSLACAKLRPLLKHPKGREIGDTDTFTLNTSFTHDRFRIKVNSIQLKETQEENKETHERVAADRQYETQAAIVRIMKAKKTIGHAELIAETIKATITRGTLQPGDIKKQVDKLIDKEYMEREEGNRYSYLA